MDFGEESSDIESTGESTPKNGSCVQERSSPIDCVPDLKITIKPHKLEYFVRVSEKKFSDGSWSRAHDYDLTTQAGISWPCIQKRSSPIDCDLELMIAIKRRKLKRLDHVSKKEILPMIDCELELMITRLEFMRAYDTIKRRCKLEYSYLVSKKEVLWRMYCDLELMITINSRELEYSDRLYKKEVL